MVFKMNDKKLPTTRYTGSKQKIVTWIWDNIKDLNFNSFLDAFSGTSVVGYYAKKKGKQITSNDILKSNHIIAKAVIENNSVKLTENDLKFILTKQSERKYPTFIQDTFQNIYFTDEENEWLDIVITNIKNLKDSIKQALAYYCLFQSCIIKRPYNLFHRKNLYMRTSDVKRGFGNKTTWDKSFEEHFRNFAKEVNFLIYDNKKQNASTNLDVFDLKGKFDLVYIDTPYFSSHSMIGIDYRDFYHFLEGILMYDEWIMEIDDKSKHKRLTRIPSVWTDKTKIHDAFERLFEKFKDSIIVVSYRSGGLPTEEEFTKMLKKHKRNVKVIKKSYKYALSNENGNKELLFIAT